jgi:hypothetical protein
MSYLLENKSNVFFNTKLSLDTAISAQSISTTVVDITGSEIKYTPHPQATKVLYECYLQSRYNPDASNGLNIELVEDGTGKGDNYSVMYTDVYVYYQTTRYIRFLLQAYNGSKTFKLRCRTNGTGNEQELHKNSDNELFYPIVIISSIL